MDDTRYYFQQSGETASTRGREKNKELIVLRSQFFTVKAPQQPCGK